MPKGKKLLFVHSGEKLKYDSSGRIYCDGSYPSDLWPRYRQLADDITVIFRKDKETYTPEIAKKKFNVVPDDINVITTPDLNSGIKSYLSLQKRREIREIIETEIKKTDILVARIPSDGAYIAIDLAKKYHKPYMVEVVGCPWDSLWNHSLKGKVLALPSMLRMKKYCKNAPYLVYVSSEFLQKRYPSKGIQTNCSNVILPEPKRSTLENRLKKIEQAKAPLKLGTLAAVDVAYKGQQYVIEALAKLKQQGQIYHYEIAGSGDQSRLKSLAEKLQVADQVKFLGSIPHAQVSAWLDSIDIYIQPSNQEGLCRSLIEAMSRACPCVASDAGGDPELLDPAFIFKKKHVAQLISELQSLATPSTMTAQARRNFSEAKKYTNDEISKRRNKLYEKFKSDNKRTKTC